ncbi:MAG: hypothetical protein LUE17_08690 [Planctomycetaceae bacterium]|nr:hypothetical protein [Planctomycetaceae bacterium]
MKKTVTKNGHIKYDAEFGDTHDYMGNKYPNNEHRADAQPPAISVDIDDEDIDAEQKDPAVKAAVDKLMEERAERDREDAQNSPGRLLHKLPLHYVGMSDLTPKIEDDLGTPRHEYESSETYTRPKTRTLDDLRASLWEILYRLWLFPEAGEIPAIDIASLSGDEVRAAVREYGYQLLCILGPRHEAQLVREDEALNAGIKRYREQVQKLRRVGHASESLGGKTIIDHYAKKVSELNFRFLEKVGSGQAGYNYHAARVLHYIESGVASYITVRIAFDAALHGTPESRGWTQLFRRIGDAILAEIQMKRGHYKDSAFYQFKRAQIRKYSGKTDSRSRKRVREILEQLREERREVKRKHESKGKAIDQRAAEIAADVGAQERDGIGLRLLEHLRLVARTEQEERRLLEPAFFPSRLTTGRNSRPKYIVAAQWLIDAYSVQNDIGLDNHAMIRPMVTFPNPWILATKHIGILPGGYRGALRATHRQQDIVKRADEEHLRLLDRATARSNSLLRRTIHGLQNTAFRINKRVLVAIETIKRDYVHSDVLAPLAPRDLPHFADMDKEDKRRAYAIHFRKGRPKRLALEALLSEADANRNESVIFFPHTFDFRGRVYPQGGPLNPQGNDLTRSLLEFAEGRKLGTEEAAEALAVHGANCFGNGIDKRPLAERVQWVHKHSAEIRRIAEAETPHGFRLWHDASDKYQFLAFCYDWGGYLQDGLDHISHLPVYVDGTCNGYQHLSALMRSRSTGKLVGMAALDSGEERLDLYQAVMKVVGERIAADANAGDKTAQRIMEAAARKPEYGPGFSIGRNLAKKPVMTYGYGAVHGGMSEGLKKKFADDYSEGEIADEQWAILTERQLVTDKDGELVERGGLGIVCRYLTKLFFEAISTEISGAADARTILDTMGKRLAGSWGGREPSAIRWTSPAGFPVLLVEYAENPGEGEAVIFGETVRFQNNRYLTETKEVVNPDGTTGIAEMKIIDASKTAKGFAPDVVHSLDASHLMFTIDRCLSEGMRSFVTTHDCYGTLAADMPRMNIILRETFVDMYRNLDMKTLAAHLAQENGIDRGELGDFDLHGDLDLDDVLKSEFFFS